MKIYAHLIHTVCLLHVSATLLAILKGEHYKDHTTNPFLTNAQIEESKFKLSILHPCLYKSFCNISLVDTSLRIVISVAETCMRHAVYKR
jgi:hypothetical protein